MADVVNSDPPKMIEVEPSFVEWLLWAVLTLALLACIMATVSLLHGCTPGPAGPVTPPGTPPYPAVLAKLRDAGCVPPDDSGDELQALMQAYQTDALPPGWGCLFSGGSVSQCNPCPSTGDP